MHRYSLSCIHLFVYENNAKRTSNNQIFKILFYAMDYQKQALVSYKCPMSYWNRPIFYFYSYGPTFIFI